MGDARWIGVPIIRGGHNFYVVPPQWFSNSVKLDDFIEHRIMLKSPHTAKSTDDYWPVIGRFSKLQILHKPWSFTVSETAKFHCTTRDWYIDRKLYMLQCPYCWLLKTLKFHSPTISVDSRQHTFMVRYEVVKVDSWPSFGSEMYLLKWLSSISYSRSSTNSVPLYNAEEIFIPL